MLITIALFILVLGVLVVVHEAGHFWAARKAGIRVDEFGFGLPPRMVGVKRGGVLYSLNWLPFGGFVRIFGESGEGYGDQASFATRPARVRLAVLLAGIAGNICLAAVLLSFGQWLGIPVSVADEDETPMGIRVHIGAVAKASPAEQAGFLAGDRLARLRDQEGNAFEPSFVKDVQDFVRRNAGKELSITIARGDEVLEKTVVPRVSPPEGEGPLGVSLLRVGIVRYPWYEAPYRGILMTGGLTITLVDGVATIFRDLFLGRGLAEGVAGPVGIASLTGQVRALGLPNFLQFMAILSLNLGLLNLLPIPALDGGRAAFVVAEKIIGKRISMRAEQATHTIGFVLLITFLFWISVRDIEKFF